MGVKPGCLLRQTTTNYIFLKYPYKVAGKIKKHTIFISSIILFIGLSGSKVQEWIDVIRKDIR